MEANVALKDKAVKTGKTKKSIAKRIMMEPWMYIMMLPGLIYYLVFKYLPMWGVLFAFQDYSLYLGFLGSKWVGLKHFIRIFTGPDFIMLMKNTLWIAFLNLVFYFPLPIILSLMLNEVRHEHYKKAIQTVIYIPHFLSWVVIVSISFSFLTVDGGLLNNIIKVTGGQQCNFLMNPKLFRPLIILQIIWKECGWGTIIFLAALAGVDVSLYEAAIVDGANRFEQLWHITLPAIRSTIVIMLILRLGRFMDTGFEQLYLMISPNTRQVGEVFDTYIYTTGLQDGQFSFATAMGLFKSVVGLILVLSSDKIAKTLGDEGIL